MEVGKIVDILREHARKIDPDSEWIIKDISQSDYDGFGFIGAIEDKRTGKSIPIEDLKEGDRLKGYLVAEFLEGFAHVLEVLAVDNPHILRDEEVEFDFTEDRIHITYHYRTPIGAEHHPWSDYIILQKVKDTD